MFSNAFSAALAPELASTLCRGRTAFFGSKSLMQDLPNQATEPLGSRGRSPAVLGVARPSVLRLHQACRSSAAVTQQAVRGALH
jgi:hypothetical protein